MLKRRVMIGLMFDEGVLTRTKHFRSDYRYTQQFLAVEAIDEAVLVDISRGGPSRASERAIGDFAGRTFAPVTIGGHVASVRQVGELLRLGADKVVIGRAALENPSLITEISLKYGSQACVVACDVLDGEVVHGATGRKTGKTPVEWAMEAERCGAGELYLQSVGRDGSLNGFDLPTLLECAAAIAIPVIIGTGCGSWRHIEEAFAAGANGAVTTCVHHWTETALMGFKDKLAAAGLPIRRVA